MNEIKLIIARNIALLRLGKKMTQLELAESLNYSDKAVSKWERGESLPDIITLKRIADLFGVTVDYIITPHTDGEKPPEVKVKKHNRILITLIAFFVVWLIGTCIFVFSGLFEQQLWFAFVFCLPISVLVLVIFNSIWGKKALNLFLVSALMWSALLTIYLSLWFFAEHNFWLLFTIGAPGQIIILLCFRIKGTGKTARQAIIDHYNSRPRRVRKQPAPSDEKETTDEPND